jgi:hypothetical protein
VSPAMVVRIELSHGRQPPPLTVEKKEEKVLV